MIVENQKLDLDVLELKVTSRSSGYYYYVYDYYIKLLYMYTIR